VAFQKNVAVDKQFNKKEANFIQQLNFLEKT